MQAVRIVGSDGSRRADGARDRRRSRRRAASRERARVRHQQQRRQRARDAALSARERPTSSAAEEPFDASGTTFRARLVHHHAASSRDDLDKAAKDARRQGVRDPRGADRRRRIPARAARVAIMHTWTSTQTEGWWRQAFDAQHVPYDYISTQDVAKTPNLNAKYDVISFRRAAAARSRSSQGMPMWRNPMPWKNDAATRPTSARSLRPTTSAPDSAGRASSTCRTS